MPSPISPYGLLQQFVSPFDFTGRTRINQREQMRAMILKDLDIGAQLPEPESTTYFEGAHFVQDTDAKARADLGAVRFSTSVMVDPEDNKQAKLVRNEDIDLDERFKPVPIDPEAFIVECDPAIGLATLPGRSGIKKVRTGKVNARGISAKLPGDHPGILVRGSEEFSQHLILHPSFMNVLFASTAGDPGSTLVADIDDKGRIDKTRVGGLDTVFRVGPDWKKYCPVALDFTADARSPSISKGLFTSSGLFGFNLGEPPTHAYAGESGGGVNAAGAGQADRHRVGTNKALEHFAQGHICAHTPIYADPVRDAPEELQAKAYEQVNQKGSVPWEVERRYDPTSQHVGLGVGALPVVHAGLLRWQMFLPLFIVKPPPIPYPPKKPKERKPVGDPKGNPDGGFVPPLWVPNPLGGDKIIIKPKPEGDFEIPPFDPFKNPLKPITPSDPIDGSKTEPPKPYDPFGGDPERVVLSVGAASRGVNGGSSIPTETTEAPNNDSVIEAKHLTVIVQGIIDPDLELVEERVYFGAATKPIKSRSSGGGDPFSFQDSRTSTGGWASQELRGVTRELKEIARDQDIAESRKLRINKTLHVVSEMAAQSIALFPRHLCARKDFRYNPAASPEDLERELSKAPAVGRIEVLGPQKGSTWNYTSEPGGTSRYNSGTASGARWLMPPEYDTDFLKKGTLPSSFSTTYMGLWESRLAFGTPDLATGGVKDGFSRYYNGESLCTYEHDSAGAQTLHSCLKPGGTIDAVGFTIGDEAITSYNTATITGSFDSDTYAPGSIGTILFINTSGGTLEAQLNDPALFDGKFLILKDSTGSFSTNNLTFDPGSNELDGTTAPGPAIDDWESITLTSNGTDWFIV